MTTQSTAMPQASAAAKPSQSASRTESVSAPRQTKMSRNRKPDSLSAIAGGRPSSPKGSGATRKTVSSAIWIVPSTKPIRPGLRLLQRQPVLGERDQEEDAKDGLRIGQPAVPRKDGGEEQGDRPDRESRRPELEPRAIALDAPDQRPQPAPPPLVECRRHRVCHPALPLPRAQRSFRGTRSNRITLSTSTGRLSSGAAHRRQSGRAGAG